jgi:hypothetical protein
LESASHHYKGTTTTTSATHLFTLAVDQLPTVIMDNNPNGSDDSHDEENGFFSSDGEDDPAMYGIRAPRRSAAREWRFDSLRISHMMDMHDMLQILEDIISYMFSLLPYTLGLVAYLRRTGAAIQDKILFVIEATRKNVKT